MDAVANFFKAISLSQVLVALGLFVVSFGLSLAIVSFVLVKIPPTYFKQEHPRDFLAQKHGAVRIAATIGKNVLGVLLVAVGIVLSLPGVPGQGILTILLGIMLLDFPGKRRLEYRLISRPTVLNAVNRLRARFGKPKLILE